jgi:hypothetical protein
MKADEIRKLGEELSAAMGKGEDGSDVLAAKLAAEFVAQLAEMNERFARDAEQFSEMVSRGKGAGA